MLNPWVLAGGITALVLAGAGGFKFGNDFAEGRAAREEVLIRKAGDAAAERAALAINKIAMKTYPIRERIETTIRELPAMPIECNTPVSVAEDINKARAP